MAYRKQFPSIKRADGRIVVDITYNSDYDDYRVRITIDCVRQQGADYFTDDALDAKGTALIMATQAETQLTHTTRKLEWTA